MFKKSARVVINLIKVMPVYLFEGNAFIKPQGFSSTWKHFETICYFLIANI